jgi:hypothetical protein
VIPCKSEKEFGEMTLVINGRNYTLDNYDWMFSA